LEEESKFTATISLPPTYSFIPLEISLPPPPFNWNHYLLKATNDLPLPNPNDLFSVPTLPRLLWSMGLCCRSPPPILSVVSTPRFQPQNHMFWSLPSLGLATVRSLVSLSAKWG
jgi:hypothetical protein